MGTTYSPAPQAPLFSGKELWRLIWPLLVEQFLSVLVGAADTMMVSRVGEAAISGVSLVDMINVLIITLFAALATGGAVVVSQYLGARNMERANLSAAQLVLLSGILGLVIGLSCALFAGPVISVIYSGLEPDVYAASCIYFRITALSFPFLAVYNAGAAIFRSVGNSKVSMSVSILMNAINVTGNAVCIFGLHMGVAGVAWPSVLSRSAAAVLILYLAMSDKNPIRIRFSDMDHINLRFAKRILNIGIPSALENSLFQAGRIIVVNMITLFGTVQISANAVANNIDGLFTVPGQAVGLAMITVVGRCIGAKDHKQAVRYTKLLTFIAYAVLWLSGGMILLLLPRIMTLYALSGETKELAVLLITMHSVVGMLLWPLSFTFPNALRAAGDVRFTMGISILSMALLRIGFSYVLAVKMGMGAVGVWFAMFADWICRLTCFVARFLSGAWKTRYQEG